MKTITELPLLYLGFASLHLLLGHFGSSLIYSLRFNQNPLVLYKKREKSLHLKYTRWIGFFSVLWAISLISYAFWPSFNQGFLVFSPLWELNPAWGWAFGGVGLCGMLYSQFQMGRAFRIGQDGSEETNQDIFMNEGLYRYSRNPIYVFSVICLLGPTLWVPSIALMFILLFIAIGIHGLVLEEEKFLKNRFGAEFAWFCREVPRYLGMPRRLEK